MIDYAQARRLMVDGQLRTFDVNDVAVLAAFDTVPRERFVPPGREDFSYSDQPLKLGSEDGDLRVMPPAALLARLVQALNVRPGRRALDVASGYGYGAAVLAELGARVVALESNATLAEAARERLGNRANVVEGSLGEGAAGEGPFDAILVEGRIESRPNALLEQLAEDGRLACVLGPDRAAKATLYVRAGDAISSRPLFSAALPGLKAFATENAFTF